MKTIITILLIVSCGYVALGQNRSNLYLDAALNERGLSATFDRKLTRHFDIGIGINTYNFSGMSYGNVRSAGYLDFRPFWEIRRSLLFVFADAGLAINGGRKPDSATMSKLGAYTALGFGYCYRINKRGIGPYMSLGINGATQTVHYNDHPATLKNRDYGVLDADLLLSIGFKF